MYTNVINSLVAQGVITKEQAYIILKNLKQAQDKIDESVIESLSECV